jgi:hypothetical protein
LLVCHTIAHHWLRKAIHISIARVKRLDRVQAASFVRGISCRVSSAASRIAGIISSSNAFGEHGRTFIVSLTFFSRLCGRLCLLFASLGVRSRVGVPVRRLAVTLWDTLVSWYSTRVTFDRSSRP